MFKSARWRIEKNKVKVVFKLQFHAAQLTQIGSDALMISIIPVDAGKPTVKSDKAIVRDGSCFWENPVYETVKFNRDPKSGKIHEKIYYFVVGTGSSKSGVIGEASIDFSIYAEVTKVSLVSLPLKNSKTEAVLHVSIQRMQESTDQRDVKELDDARVNPKDHSLRSQLSNIDSDEITRNTSFDDVPFNKTVATVTDLNGNRQASIGSDITITSSESSSGIETPWEEPHIKNVNVQLAPSTDDSSSTPRENFLIHDSEEASETTEKLKTEISALSRQAEMSELELQTLRKQIVKKSKRGQDLYKEVVCLKEERDTLKAEIEKRVKNKTDLNFDGGDSQATVEELRQELNHAKEIINNNLQIQLQKTQDSNSELILAVRDLDEMLEKKNKEMLSVSNGEEVVFVCQSDDEEQNALEELVKNHSDAKEVYFLEQQIMDLKSEIEIYKRDKDELETQMEQLALDYEIMKQENHDMAYKLEQSELQEQLKMQYECSSTYNVHELENQIENLENELKIRSEECENLESHVKSLEEELEKQTQEFEADLESLTRSKVKQEQRAIRAEETLRKTRWQNANTAERLQEEFRRLSVQMTSTFEANEKLAAKALAEANELRYQKSHLEELLQKASEECGLVKDHYEARVSQLSGQVEQLHSEIKERTVQLENQKNSAKETQRLLSNEIVMLKDKLEMLTAKNKILSEEMVDKETLMHELAQMRVSIKEMELVIELGNEEGLELESRFMVLKNEADESNVELNRLRSLLEEKEPMVELDSLQIEGHIKVKEGDLEKSTTNTFLEKEKDFHNAIEELEGRLEAINQSSTCYCENEMQVASVPAWHSNGDSCLSDAQNDSTNKYGDLDELMKEIASVKERNESMEGELKEMQEKYSEISLMFAEVEGERQQLVMKLRNLQNSKKSS